MANKVTDEQMRRMCNDAKKLGFRPERLMLLDKKITEWSKSDMTPTIVARVLRHGQLAFEGAYGIQGPGSESDSLTTDAIFPVCSITKPVISALLFVLQEEGDIDVNHPVRMYMPEFTGDAKSEVRIWHLLTHTSGLLDDELSKYFDKFVTQMLGLKLPDHEAPDDEHDEINLKIREKMGLPYMAPGRAMRYDTYLKAGNKLNIIIKADFANDPEENQVINKADSNTLHRSSFLHIFSICYLAWLPVILITVFLNTTLEDFIGIALSGAALMGISAFILVLAYPVAISGDGIKIRNSSGKSCFISWHEIERVKPVKFLHLNYIKLFSVNYIKPLWMPFTFTLQSRQMFLEA